MEGENQNLEFKRTAFRRRVQWISELLRNQLDGNRFADFRAPTFRESVFRILVTGKSRVGKSSFLNILIGNLCGMESLYCCPVNHNSCTTCVWKVKYSEKMEVRIYAKENDEDEEISLLENIVFDGNATLAMAKKINQISRELRKDEHRIGFYKDRFVQYVELGIPQNELRHFEIIDSPGVGEIDRLNRLVREEYRNAGFVVYVSKANDGSGMSADDLDRIRRIDALMSENFNTSLFDRFAFIATHADVFLGEERMHHDPSYYGEEEEEPIQMPDPAEEVKRIKEIINQKLQAKFVAMDFSKRIHLFCNQPRGKTHEDLYKQWAIHFRDYIMEESNRALFEFPATKCTGDLLSRIRQEMEMRQRVEINAGNPNYENELRVRHNRIREGLQLLETGYLDGCCNRLRTSLLRTIGQGRHDIRQNVCAPRLSHITELYGVFDKDKEAFTTLRTRFVGSIRRMVSPVVTTVRDEMSRHFETVRNQFHFADITGRVDLLIPQNWNYTDVNSDYSGKTEELDGFGAVVGGVAGDFGGALAGATLGSPLGPVGMFIGAVMGGILRMGAGAVGAGVGVGKLRKGLGKDYFDENWRKKTFDTHIWDKFDLGQFVGRIVTRFREAVTDRIRVVRGDVQRRIDEIVGQRRRGYNTKIQQIRDRERRLRTCMSCQFEVFNLEYDVHDFHRRIAIDQHNVVGRGAFGEVRRVSIDGNNSFVMKTINLEQNNLEYSFGSVMKEIHVLCMAKIDRAQNLVPLIACRGIFDNNNNNNNNNNRIPRSIQIVMKYYHGSLSALLLDRTQDDKFDVTTRKSLMMQVCRGLQFLHQRSFIYRDLKPENILVSEDLKDLRICDYGISTPIAMNNNTMIGTQLFMDPLVASGMVTNYGREVDIYSLGLVLAMIWEKKYPVFRDFRVPTYNQQQLQNVLNQNMLIRLTRNEGELEASNHQALQELLDRCTSLEREQRPTVQNVIQVLKNDVFTKKRRRNYDDDYDDDETEPPIRRRRLD